MDGVRIRVSDLSGAIAAEVVSGPIDRNGDGRVDPETEVGQWQIEELDAGTFRILTLPPEGFGQTLPDLPFERTVTLASGEAADGLLFGVGKKPAIRGVVFLDLDRDGVRDRNEPGVPDVRVCALISEDDCPEDVPDTIGFQAKSTFDDFDTPEDETGQYEITANYPTTFYVDARLQAIGDSPANYVKTVPLEDRYTVDVEYEKTVDQVNFGVRPAAEVHYVLVTEPSEDAGRTSPP